LSEKLIQQYAITLATQAILEATENDLDDDAVFCRKTLHTLKEITEGCTDCNNWKEALKLAEDIAYWIQHHPNDMVHMVKTEIPEIG
jgi:hypothetical protein